MQVHTVFFRWLLFTQPHYVFGLVVGNIFTQQGFILDPYILGSIRDTIFHLRSLVGAPFLDMHWCWTYIEGSFAPVAIVADWLLLHWDGLIWSEFLPSLASIFFGMEWLYYASS